MRRYVLALAVSVGAGTSAAILSGYVMVGRGDPSNRLITSFRAARDLLAYASDWANWSGTWPAAYFLLQGAGIRTLEAIGIHDTFLLIQAVLWVSVIAWVIVLWGVHSTVKRVAGREWAWISVASLLALPLLTELSHNAYAAIYFAALFVVCLRSLAEFEATGRWRWLVASGLVLLAGSTLRTEAVILSAALALVVLLRHGWLRATVFGGLAASLTVARGVAAIFAGGDTALFFQQVPQSFARRVLDLVALALYLLVPTAVVLGVLYRQLVPRLPREVPRERAARIRLAEYAGASAVSLYAFFFAAMLALPMLGPDSRFLLVPSVATIIVIVCLSTASAVDAWSSMRRWLAPWVVLSWCAQTFLLGVDWLTDSARPLPEIRDAAAWLRENGGEGRLLAIDHLYWWEETLLLYGASSSDVLLSSHIHDAGPSTSDYVPRPTTLAEATGAYLALYRPRFLVRQGPEAARLRGLPDALLDPWLSGSGDVWRVTPLGATTPRATARTTLSNDWLEVLEVEWMDPR